MKKIIGITSAFVVILLIAVGGFYLWKRGQKTVSPVVVNQEPPTSSETPILSEASSSSVVQEPQAQPEVDRGGCMNSDKYISELGDGRFLYKNEDLAISFTYPKAWGNPHVNFYDYEGIDDVDGTRCTINFSPIEYTATPFLYISSNDFDLHAPSGAWGLDANQVDLAKSDEELIDRLASSYASSVKLERRAVSGSRGIVLEEKGEDPLHYEEQYHHFYYLFPKYNMDQSKNLMIAVLYDADRQIIEGFLDTVVFY